MESSHQKPAHQPSKYYAEIAVGVLVVALIILCVLLTRQYRLAERQGIISAERMHFSDIAHHRPLGPSDVSLIEPWMTFDYVSFSFKVPLSLIEAGLLAVPVSASGTPSDQNITLGHYAHLAATSSEAVTTAVRQVVQQFLIQKYASTTPAGFENFTQASTSFAR